MSTNPLKKDLSALALAIMAAVSPAKAEDIEKTDLTDKTKTEAVIDAAEYRQQMFEEAVRAGAPKDEVIKYMDFPEWLPVTKSGKLDEEKVEQSIKHILPYVEAMKQEDRISNRDAYDLFVEKTGWDHVSFEDYKQVKKQVEDAQDGQYSDRLRIVLTAMVLAAVALAALGDSPAVINIPVFVAIMGAAAVVAENKAGKNDAELMRDAYQKMYETYVEQNYQEMHDKIALEERGGVAQRKQMLKEAIKNDAPRKEIVQYIDFPKSIPVTSEGQFDKEKATDWAKTLEPCLIAIHNKEKKGEEITPEAVYKILEHETGKVDMSFNDFKKVYSELKDAKGMQRYVGLVPVLTILLGVGFIKASDDSNASKYAAGAAVIAATLACWPIIGKNMVENVTNIYEKAYNQYVEQVCKDTINTRDFVQQEPVINNNRVSRQVVNSPLYHKHLKRDSRS